MKQSITSVLTNNFMPYAAKVIIDRALPQIDGLKPSQRRVLYAMYESGLLKGKLQKSAKIVGNVIGNFHPHGDQSAYETMVRMTVDHEALTYPYVESKGNYGKYYSDTIECASYRYTEAKLSPITQEMFAGIKKNVVDMIPTFDDTNIEPVILPVTLPFILMNPISGTAVGMSTEIPSFHLSDLVDYIEAFINNPESHPVDYLTPDFPSGSYIIYDKEQLRTIYDTGKGSFTLRAKYEITDDTNIRIYELPYGVKIENVMEKIRLLVSTNKIKEIVDINDLQGIDSNGIGLTVKKNTDKDLLMKKLYKMTELESKFSCNMNLIIDKSPKLLNIKQIIKEWLKFRIRTVKREFEYDLNKLKDETHLIEGYIKIIDVLERIIEIVRFSKSDELVIETLMSEFNLTKVQAENVLKIRLRNITKEYLQSQIDEMAAIQKEIDYYTNLLNNKSDLLAYIVNQLKTLKDKYYQPRKTTIIHSDEVEEISIEKEIDDYNLKLFITKQHYIKKIPLTSLRNTTTQKLKDDDEIIEELDLTNKSDVLVFTDKYNVYKLKLHELDDVKVSQLGEYVPSLLKLKDENIVHITGTVDYKGYLLIGFENGKVAKIDLAAYYTKQNRSMLKNAYSNESKVVFMKVITNDVDLVIQSNADKVLVFNSANINVKTSKITIGVQVMKLKDNQTVIKTAILTDNFPLDDVDYYRRTSASTGYLLKQKNLKLF